MKFFANNEAGSSFSPFLDGSLCASMTQGFSAIYTPRAVPSTAHYKVQPGSCTTSTQGVLVNRGLHRVGYTDQGETSCRTKVDITYPITG